MNLQNNKSRVFFHGVDYFTRTGIIALIGDNYTKGKAVIFTDEYTMRHKCICSESSEEFIWIGLSNRKLSFVNSICVDDKIEIFLKKMIVFLVSGNENFCWVCHAKNEIKLNDWLIISILKRKEVMDAARALNINAKTLYSRVNTLQVKLGFTHRIDFRLWCISYTSSVPKYYSQK